MRLWLAIFILIGFGSALSAQEQEGQADLSSRFMHEPGFAVEGEMRSKAKLFLDDVRPEEFYQKRKPATELSQSESHAADGR